VSITNFNNIPNITSDELQQDINRFSRNEVSTILDFIAVKGNQSQSAPKEWVDFQVKYALDPFNKNTYNFPLKLVLP
jgi:hypothetical protein